MGLQAALASFAGDLWKSWGCVAFWPWPAVVFRMPHPKFTSKDYRRFTRRLLPGDFILTRSDPYFLSNRAIKGTALKHLAVYTGQVAGFQDPKTGFIRNAASLGLYRKHTGTVAEDIFERTCVHAISEGVVCQDLIEVLFHADYAVAVRPWLDEDQQGAIVEAAIDQIGADYDFRFKQTPEDLYCTELGCHCCRKGGVDCPDTVKVNTSIAGLILPIDYFKTPVTLADHFVERYEVVCASRLCSDPAFHKKSRIREALRKKLA